MIIAIDGPAGSGKSTVAKQVACELGFHYLDTGAMYRSVAAAALAADVDVHDEAAVARIAREQAIAFAHEPGSPMPTGVSIAGRDVTREIRTAPIDAVVSVVSAHPAVREALVAQQRAIAAGDDIVMEGRDIGTVVFPDAQLKVFLTADAACRAKRRALQNAQRGAGETDADVLCAQIKERDLQDSTREVAPLRPAADARELDTTDLSIDEVVARIAAWAREVRGAGEAGATNEPGETGERS